MSARRSLVVAWLACTAGTLALAGGLPAPALADTVMPSGGAFTLPLQYTTSTSCGQLCSLSVVPVATGSGYALNTTYTPATGLLGTASGSAAIDSPTFTYTGATPASVTLELTDDVSLGMLLGHVAPQLQVTLADVGAQTSTVLYQTALSADALSPQAVTVPVAPGLLVGGHQYQLQIGETYTNPLDALGTATVGLSNVGLDVAAATSDSGSGRGGGGTGGTGGTGSGTGGTGSGTGTSTGTPGTGTPTVTPAPEPPVTGTAGPAATTGSGTSPAGSTGPAHGATAACVAPAIAGSARATHGVRIARGRVLAGHPLRIQIPRALTARYRIDGGPWLRLRHGRLALGITRLRGRRSVTVRLTLRAGAHRTRSVTLVIGLAGCPG